MYVKPTTIIVAALALAVSLPAVSEELVTASEESAAISPAAAQTGLYGADLITNDRGPVFLCQSAPAMLGCEAHRVFYATAAECEAAAAHPSTGKAEWMAHLRGRFPALNDGVAILLCGGAPRGTARGFPLHFTAAP